MLKIGMIIIVAAAVKEDTHTRATRATERERELLKITTNNSGSSISKRGAWKYPRVLLKPICYRYQSVPAENSQARAHTKNDHERGRGRGRKGVHSKLVPLHTESNVVRTISYQGR